MPLVESSLVDQATDRTRNTGHKYAHNYVGVVYLAVTLLTLQDIKDLFFNKGTLDAEVIFEEIYIRKLLTKDEGVNELVSRYLLRAVE